MADYTGIFERVEQKYLLDSLQFEALWAVLEPYMRPDEYGRSNICNIYFDTPNYLLARLSGEKPSIKKSCVCVPTACRKRKAVVCGAEEKISGHCLQAPHRDALRRSV